MRIYLYVSLYPFLILFCRLSSLPGQDPLPGHLCALSPDICTRLFNFFALFLDTCVFSVLPVNSQAEIASEWAQPLSAWVVPNCVTSVN